jgi:hypothetical protein
MKKTIYLKAPINIVFKALIDIEEQKKWMLNLVDIKFPNGQEVGKDFLLYIKEGPKVNEYKGITKAMVENKFLEVYIYNDCFAANTKYSLEENEQNTVLHYENTVELKTTGYKIMWSLVGRFFATLMLKKMLVNLKKLVETKPI